MKFYLYLSASFLTLFLFSQCNSEPKADSSEVVYQEPELPPVDARFTLMPPKQTGVKNSNKFVEDYNYNIFTYEYIYNGCGVAAGDVNGDGLPDLYFSTAFGPNRLYLNLGDFRFLDITKVSGVAALKGFKTGVTMADINGDGRMDLYSCRTSKSDDGLKTNHVFINMGNKPVRGNLVPYFEDKAVEMGLDDNSDSNQACFFDYDLDGDLDLFILNHRIGFRDAAKLRLLEQPDGSVKRLTTPETPFESNQLFRNDGEKFVDVTAEAGLVNSAFGLSVTPVDIDKDGWMDLYVANDFIEPDYIYINNRDGTFTDRYFEFLRHSSQNSMGSDVADINNDGLDDIVVMDMKAEDPYRYKELATVMTYDRYNLLVQYGYGRQVGRNMLQLNVGNNSYVDIGQFAGVAATDWSWAPLVADFDNDGWKDLYVTNGYRRDITNLDYTNYFRDSIDRTGGVTPRRFPDIYEVLEHIPEKRLRNYLYINTGQLSFIDAGVQAGMTEPSFSNGAAYADLDMDGDLDIIVHNIDDPVFLYRNDISNRNWLQLTVPANESNPPGYGTVVEIVANGQYQRQTLMNTKGFLSSSEPIIHFGLDQAATVDTLIITWPGGDQEIMTDVQVNQRLELIKGQATAYKGKTKKETSPLFSKTSELAGWTHGENKFVDFKTEKLLPYMLSAEGPCISIGDINGDNLEDVFAGSGTGYPAAVFTQNSNGGFSKTDLPVLERDASFEDCGSVLEDFDGDGDTDLFVISGGSEKHDNSTAYRLRMYWNDGQGNFSSDNTFPDIRTNAGAVKAFDYDDDGDLDILVGGKSVPGRFPTIPNSYFLRNDNGKFADVTADVLPDEGKLGMISDIATGDVNGDGKEEIVLAGEWMPVTILAWDGASYTNQTKSFGFDQTNGWWKTVEVSDLDGDGNLDIIAGNLGLNHRMETSPEYPITMVTNDFDNNGFLDPIMCFYYKGNLYPFAGRDAIIAQIPILKKKFLRYKPYASATINDIFTKSELSNSTYLYTHTLETTYFKNNGGAFSKAELPYQVQLHPTNDILVHDFNDDGRLDLLLAGNFLYAETETGEIDGGNGSLLLQNEDGGFEFIENRDHGFWATGEVRELHLLNAADGQKAILTGNNQGPIEMHKISGQ